MVTIHPAQWILLGHLTVASFSGQMVLYFYTDSRIRSRSFLTITLTQINVRWVTICDKSVHARGTNTVAWEFPNTNWVRTHTLSHLSLILVQWRMVQNAQMCMQSCRRGRMRERRVSGVYLWLGGCTHRSPVQDHGHLGGLVDVAAERSAWPGTGVAAVLPGTATAPQAWRGRDRQRLLTLTHHSAYCLEEPKKHLQKCPPAVITSQAYKCFQELH